MKREVPLAVEDDNRPIEEKFLESWDEIEFFYGEFFAADNYSDWLKPIFGLISDLRVRGYDRLLRAGQSMHRFILSRAQKHGLLIEKPHLVIDVRPQGGMVVTYYSPPDPVLKLNSDRVELTPELEQLLSKLLAHPIS